MSARGSARIDRRPAARARNVRDDAGSDSRSAPAPSTRDARPSGVDLRRGARVHRCSRLARSRSACHRVAASDEALRAARRTDRTERGGNCRVGSRTRRTARPHPKINTRPHFAGAPSARAGTVARAPPDCRARRSDRPRRSAANRRARTRACRWLLSAARGRRS